MYNFFDETVVIGPCMKGCRQTFFFIINMEIALFIENYFSLYIWKAIFNS